MGNTPSADGPPGARFLMGCPPIPPPPASEDVLSQFESLLRSKLVTSAVLDELNAIESEETKWMYICLDKFLASPEATDKELLDPSACIYALSDLQTQQDNLHDLFRAIRINTILRAKDWVEKFVVADGIPALLVLIDPAKTSLAGVVHTEVLNALLALSHSNRGVNAMVQTVDCCDRLLALYSSATASNALRGSILKLLGVMCCHSQTAQAAVVSAVKRESATNAVSSKFGLLAAGLIENKDDPAFQLAVVTFVNVVVNTTLSANERVAIRDDLETKGFITQLEKYRQDGKESASPAMMMQIQVFLKSHANDRAKMQAAPSQPVQRRLSLSIPSASDEPATTVVVDTSVIASPTQTSSDSAGSVQRRESGSSGSVQSTPQREGPRSLQARKSLKLDMVELHTETEEASGVAMISPPPAPDPMQRRPSGSLLPSLSIPKTNVAFSAPKSASQSTMSGSSTEMPSAPSLEVMLPSREPVASSAESKAAPSLESIIAMLQQGTKRLDDQTNHKLLQLLSTLATSLSSDSSSGGATVVDKLEKSLAQPDKSIHANEPLSSPVGITRMPLKLPSRFSDSDIYTLAAGTPAKAASSYHQNVYSRFHTVGGDSEAARPGAPRSPSAAGDLASSERSPVHSHYEEEHSPRRSMTETESYDESCHEYEAQSRKPSGAKLALAGFFQHLKKGQGLPTTPAPTPMATASVKKDARRPVFPTFSTSSAAPSPMPQKNGHIASFALPPLTPMKPSVGLSLPPLTPVRAHLVPTSPMVVPSMKAARANEEHLEAVTEEEAETPSTVSTEKAPQSSGPDISKFRKLLAMGAPRAAVRAKMQQAGVDPDLLDKPDQQAIESNPAATAVATPAPSAPAASIQAAPEECSSGPDISKFRKLLSMGAPLAAVKAKMQQAGLDPALLDQSPTATTPAPPVKAVESPEDPTPVCEAVKKSTKIKDDPDYAKFFKLRSMGAPAEAVKAKMRQAGLNPDYLDTPDQDMPSAIKPATDAAPAVAPVAAAPVRVKDDPEYAKFFKLQSMGAPAAAVKAKLLQAGLNPDLLDTPDSFMPPKASNNNAEHSPAPASEPVKKVLVKDDPEYAKFFKLKTMAPLEAVKARMRQAGLNPDLLDTPDAELPPKGGNPADAQAPPAPAKLTLAGSALSNMFAKRQAEPESQSSESQATAAATVLVKDDPAYAKFFKLVAMGAPADTVKGKMQMAGLRPELLDTPDAPLNPVANGSNQASNNSGIPPPAPVRRANLSLSIKPPASVVKPTTRPFYWQHMKGDSIRGTIWEELEKEPTKENNEPPVVLVDTELALLENEFPAQSAPMTGPKSRSMSMDQMPKELLSPRASVVFLIDRSRANNISIIIKQFRMSHAAIREAIMKVDANVLTLDRVQGLIKILPTDEEVAAIMGYSGDPLSLNEAERVLKELISVPRLKQRLTAMQSKLHFPTLARDLQQKVDRLRAASTEILQSCEFKSVLMVVLQVGNRMNQGTARGGAKGFRLGDLTKLSQLKSVDKTTTLLHYVARMLRQKKGNAVRLSESLASLYDVQNIPIPELPTDMAKVSEIVDYVSNELGAQKLKNAIEDKEPCDHFVQIMSEFLQSASQTTKTLKDDLETMLRLLKDTMQRFGFQGESESGDESTPAPADPTQVAGNASANHAALTSACEFFTIIYEFSVALTKADRENEVKRLREEARAKQSMKTKPPALGQRSMSSRDMSSGLRKPTPIEKKKDAEEPSVTGPETPELSNAKDKDKAAGPRVSPMLRQRSASLSSIVENNVNIEAVLSSLPTKSPPSSINRKDAKSSEKPKASVETKSSVDKEAAKQTTPKKAEASPESKTSALKQPSKIVKPGDKDKDAKSKTLPKPTMLVPGKIVKTSKPSPSPAQAAAAVQKQDFSVCYESPLGLTMPESLDQPKAKAVKPEFEEVMPFDMASIEEIRAQLAKKHVATTGSNNNGEAADSGVKSKPTPEESTAEIDSYAYEFEAE